MSIGDFFVTFAFPAQPNILSAEKKKHLGSFSSACSGRSAGGISGDNRSDRHQRPSKYVWKNSAPGVSAWCFLEVFKYWLLKSTLLKPLVSRSPKRTLRVLWPLQGLGLSLKAETEKILTIDPSPHRFHLEKQRIINRWAFNHWCLLITASKKVEVFKPSGLDPRNFRDTHRL